MQTKQKLTAARSLTGTRIITPECGALVISLDFELHWGVFPLERADGPYRANLLGARKAIPRILELFEQHQIAATWAIVGFLFARDRAERKKFTPSSLPTYDDPGLDPYAVETGENEAEDPLHYGASLVDRIIAAPLQEVGTHTFSHFCCLEPGQTAQQFRADLESAIAISGTRGVRPRSLVLPRNQYNAEYAEVLRELGITCYRGNEKSWMYRPCASAVNRGWPMRAGRAIDAYGNLSGFNTYGWQAMADEDGLFDVRSSTVLRPYNPALRYLEGLRKRRILGALKHAAEHGELFHIYWHPHNFGMHLEENLAFLGELLECFTKLRKRHGMQSASMLEAANAARQIDDNNERSRPEALSQVHTT